MDSKNFKDDFANWSHKERAMFRHSGMRMSEDMIHLKPGHKVHRTNVMTSHTPKGGFNPGAPLIKPTGSTVRGHQADGFTIKGDGMPVAEFKKRSGRLRNRR